jgi:hypothetical protein
MGEAEKRNNVDLWGIIEKKSFFIKRRWEPDAEMFCG